MSDKFGLQIATRLQSAMDFKVIQYKDHPAFTLIAHFQRVDF